MSLVTRWRSAKPRILGLINIFICFVRKVWRPVSLCGVAVGTWVNIVFLPLKNGTPVNLAEAAAWIASVGALSWVREWGKTKGNNDDN